MRIAPRQQNERASRRNDGARILVLGLGNTILSDDAVGILVAREVALRLNEPERVEVMEACVAGLDLLDLVTGFDRLILVDAIKTRGGRPGTVYKLHPGHLPITERLSATHEINLSTALDLARAFGLEVPSEIVIYAIEVQDHRIFGESLSPAVARAVPTTVTRVLCEALV